MISESSSDMSSKFIPAPVGGLPADTRIQDYRIKGVVGEGGFAIVYLAEDVMLHREVAIKEYMPAALAVRNSGWGVEPRSASHHETFTKGMRSFINEARLLAQFKHSALVDVLRFWEENGTAYMAMPYYRGSTLREIFRQSAFRCNEAWLRRLIEPILSGLQAMHREKCFHRDISSDNIIVLRDGNPVLLDFGAARRIVAEPDQLATIILKPGFAPIEQYSDDTATAPQGPWTDIYALCAVCYLAISGRMPTTSVARIMRDPVVPLTSQDIPGFSAGFLAAIDRGLAVRPEDRPQTIGEFSALLNQSRPAAPADHLVPTRVPLEKLPAATTSSALLGKESRSCATSPLSRPKLDSLSPSSDGPLDAETVQVIPVAKVPPKRWDTAAQEDDPLACAPELTGSRVAWLGKRGLLVGFLVVLVSLASLAYWQGSPQSVVRPVKIEQPELPQVAKSASSQLAKPVDGKVGAATSPSPAQVVVQPQVDVPAPSAAGRSATLPTSTISPVPAAPDASPPPSRATESRPTIAAGTARKQPSAVLSDAGSGSPGREAKQMDKIEVGPGHVVTKVTVEPEIPAGQQGQLRSTATPSIVAMANAKTSGSEHFGHRKGAVDLSIKPWGSVSVDGKSFGVAPPLRRITLPVGRHTLVISNPNGARLVKEITVLESNVLEVAHDFASVAAGQR